MNIDKAIEILNHLERTLAPTMAAGATDAINLGIEALKVIKEFRTGRYKTINSPLPGETQE